MQIGRLYRHNYGIHHNKECTIILSFQRMKVMLL